MTSASTEALEPYLISLCSFVTNSQSVVSVRSLSSSEVFVLSSLLASSAEIESLSLLDEPSSPVLAIREDSAVISLSVGDDMRMHTSKTHLLHTVQSALGPRMQELCLISISLDDDDCAALGNGLWECTALRRLEIYGCDVVCSLPLFVGIGNAGAIEILMFSSNHLNDKGVSVLVDKGLNRLKSLRELKLRSGGIHAEGAKAIAGLRSINQLRALDLSANSLDDQGVSALAEGLGHGSRRWSMESLCLCWNKITPNGIPKLVQLLRCVPQLRGLDISRNNFDKCAATSLLGDTIGRFSHMEILNVNGCGLNPEFFTAIRAFKTLVNLNVTYNLVGNQGAKAISKALLAGRVRIEKLDMQACAIGELGAKALSKALASSDTISSLILLQNPVGPLGAEAVFDSLGKNLHMQCIDLEDCKIGDPGAKAAARAISRMAECRGLFLGSNDIGTEGIKAIASARHAAIMERLALQHNQAGVEGAISIAEEIIRPNREVEILYLSTIGMSDEGAKAIACAVKERNRGGVLKKVKVSPRDCGVAGQNVLEELRKSEAGNVLRFCYI